MKIKIITSVIILSAIFGLGFTGHSYAATSPKTQEQGGVPSHGQFQGNRQRTPGIFGIISVINGTNFTVLSKGFGPNSATTTYSVDASNATVMTNKATSTLSAISVGNSVMVQGTINGTSVIATIINLNEGLGAGLGRRDEQNPNKSFNFKNASSTTQRRNASSTNVMEGNGQPIIGGTVSSISGTIITITNKSNVSYKIDTSAATIVKENNKISLSDLTVGDSVLVQGIINGTSVTASTITDQSPAINGASTDKKVDNKQKSNGFFGGIGSFFAKLFGF